MSSGVLAVARTPFLVLPRSERRALASPAAERAAPCPSSCCLRCLGELSSKLSRSSVQLPTPRSFGDAGWRCNVSTTFGDELRHWLNPKIYRTRCAVMQTVMPRHATLARKLPTAGVHMLLPVAARQIVDVKHGHSLALNRAVKLAPACLVWTWPTGQRCFEPCHITGVRAIGCVEVRWRGLSPNQTRPFGSVGVALVSIRRDPSQRQRLPYGLCPPVASIGNEYEPLPSLAEER